MEANDDGNMDADEGNSSVNDGNSDSDEGDLQQKGQPFKATNGHENPKILAKGKVASKY